MKNEITVSEYVSLISCLVNVYVNDLISKEEFRDFLFETYNKDFEPKVFIKGEWQNASKSFIETANEIRKNIGK